ncbi:hypothetical protein E4P42_04745 [Mycobacterium sp. PS03-16]|nr:hypothetical protein E4P42_04745 [Mycobacterium sp. PS03-16]
MLSRRSPTNRSSAESPEVNRSTSSPPSQRSSAIVTRSAERVTTLHTAPLSCQRWSSATRSRSVMTPAWHVRVGIVCRM